MKKNPSKIGLIGAGNMGEALIGALIKSKLAKPNHIFASDTIEKRRKILSKRYGINTWKDNFKLFSECDIIILAIKPQHMGSVLSEISENPAYSLSRKKLMISIAAGVSIQRLEKLLYMTLNETSRKKLPIIRVMPNTPALVLAGISGMSANKFTTRADMNRAREILESTGDVIEFDEKDLDAVTALSGSGPAYVFYFIESLIAGGVKAGLNPKHASTLALATVKGAVTLLEESGESPEALRKKVASPGGTTQAALNVLEKAHVKTHISDAINAAKKRSKELRQLY